MSRPKGTEFKICTGELPYLTTNQMQEVDRAMIEDFKTLALPKEGLRGPAVAAQVGELYLADIGVPPSLYAGATLRLNVGNIFSQSEIIRLR